MKKNAHVAFALSLFLLPLPSFAVKWQKGDPVKVRGDSTNLVEAEITEVGDGFVKVKREGKPEEKVSISVLERDNSKPSSAPAHAAAEPSHAPAKRPASDEPSSSNSSNQAESENLTEEQLDVRAEENIRERLRWKAREESDERRRVLQDKAIGNYEKDFKKYDYDYPDLDEKIAEAFNKALGEIDKKIEKNFGILRKALRDKLPKEDFEKYETEREAFRKRIFARHKKLLDDLPKGRDPESYEKKKASIDYYDLELALKEVEQRTLKKLKEKFGARFPEDFAKYEQEEEKLKKEAHAKYVDDLNKLDEKRVSDRKKDRVQSEEKLEKFLKEIETESSKRLKVILNEINAKPIERSDIIREKIKIKGERRRREHQHEFQKARNQQQLDPQYRQILEEYREGIEFIDKKGPDGRYLLSDEERRVQRDTENEAREIKEPKLQSLPSHNLDTLPPHVLRQIADYLDDAKSVSALLKVSVPCNVGAFPQSIGLNKVELPGGKFMMGSPANEEGRYDEEVQREVTVAPFAPMDTHLTRAQWRKIMGRDPDYRFCGISEQEWNSHLNKPVTCISWDKIHAPTGLLARLRQNGINARLMTEAEAEYLARLKKGKKISTTAYPFAPNQLGTYAWFEGNSDNQLRDVKTKTAIEGIYDARGNASTWVSNSYPNNSNNSNSLRVFRGGSFGGDPRFLRSAYRGIGAPGSRYGTVSVRLVIE